MSKWSLTRKIATVGCILAAISLSVFIILASDRTEDSSDTTAMPFVNAAVISPKTYGSYGELMFAYVGQGNRLYNLDNESNPVINQPVRELLYASDDSILYTAACELDHSHLGRESVIQELQIGEQENRLNTIAIVTIDPCWSSNDEVIYYTEDSSPNQLCTFEPLTSTTEVAATFDRDIKGLRISSDGLLVTLSDGSEMLYVPLSKQLADPGIPTKGNTITVCEQYDLFLTPEGTLSYHWQGSGELVTIAENVLVGVSYQDNEIYYIQQTSEETALMSFTVSEEQHNLLHQLDSHILPQLTTDADYAFMLNELGIVYRYDIQSGELLPFAFIDMETIKAPMISLFDYRLMVYDLSKEQDASFCYAIPADTILSAEETEQNIELASELGSEATDPIQYPEFRYLSMNSAGDDVVRLQNQLNAYGYLYCEPTGVYGLETMRAVSAAQGDLNLEETGNADRVFQYLLYNTELNYQLAPVFNGYSGIRAGDIRARLLSLGYLVSEPSDECDSEMLHAIELFCVQNGISFEQTITEEIQQALFEKSAPRYSGWLALKEGDIGDACYSLNSRLKSLGYTAYSPHPDIDGQTISALSLFASANNKPFNGNISSELHQYVFSEGAITCPEEFKPDALIDTSSSTPDQVITDKQLKILRKWLTKSFAVNHTDRQAVKRLQVRLKHLGYLSQEAVTMVYDEQTGEAIRRFQAEHDLVVDGIPSKRTLMAVFSITSSTLSGDE